MSSVRVAIVGALLASGCYLSHRRARDGAVDAEDAGAPDAALPICHELGPGDPEPDALATNPWIGRPVTVRSGTTPQRVFGRARLCSAPVRDGNVIGGGFELERLAGAGGMGVVWRDEWSGNVRQLANALEAALIRAAGEGAAQIARRHVLTPAIITLARGRRAPAP